MAAVLMGLAVPVAASSWATCALIVSLGAFWLSAKSERDEAGGGAGNAKSQPDPDAPDPLATAERLVSAMSHDLRGPLNAILGWTQLLEPRTDLPADVQDALKVIRRNAIRQKQLLDDVADLSQAMRGVLAIEPRPMSLASVLTEACRAIRPQMTAKGVSLTCEVDDAVTIDADARRLQRAVANLLGQALRTTPAGGAVRVEVTRRERDVLITVTDDGQGIDAETLARVFAPGAPKPVVAPDPGGIALPLSLARVIVEAHGGTIQGRSLGPGHGTTFAMSLPLTDGDRSAAPNAKGQPASRPLSGLRVLAVDDDPDWCELLDRILAAAGAEPRVARSAVDALAFSETWRPDVLLTDIAMPSMDGYELLETLRARPHFAAVPAIAMTAHAGAQERMRTRAAGFAAHLAKPIAPAQLVDALRFVTSGAPPDDAIRVRRPSGGPVG